MAVGDNQGNVYTSKEGYGKAFILPESKAIQQLPDQLDSIIDIELERQKLGLVEEKEKKALEKKLADAKPEWWWAHDNQLQTEVDDVMTMGAKIIAAGADPFSSNDPASQQFRERMSRATKKGTLSLQIKENYTKDREKASTQGDKYDPTSIEEVDVWYKNHDLNKVLDEGLLPPVFKFKQPEVNLEKMAREAAGGITKEGQPTEGDYLQIGTGLMANPNAKEMAIQYLGNAKNENPVWYQANVEAPALAQGVSPEIYYMGKLVESYRPDKPLDQKVKEIVDKMKVGSTLIESTYESETGVTGKTTEKKTPVENATAQALLYVNQVPGVVNDLVSTNVEYDVLIRDKKTGVFTPTGEKRKVTDRKTAAEFIAYQYLLGSDYQKSKSTTRQFFPEMAKLGIGEEEYKKDVDFYEQAIRGTIDNLSQWVKGAPNRPLTKDEKIKLRNWALGQSTNMELPGAKGFQISDNTVVDDVDSEGNAIKRTVGIGTPFKGGTGAVYDEKGNVIEAGLGGLVNIPIQQTDKDGKVVSKVQTYQVNPESEGANDYLTSGTIDELHRKIVLENKKKMVTELLEQDWNLVLDNNQPAATNSNSGWANPPAAKFD